MKQVDCGHDSILDVNFELHKFELSELRDAVKGWYPNTDFRDFNSASGNTTNEIPSSVIKQTGITCNYFFAYREDGNYFLLDGFNRLLTEYGNAPG